VTNTRALAQNTMTLMHAATSSESAPFAGAAPVDPPTLVEPVAELALVENSVPLLTDTVHPPVGPAQADAANAVRVTSRRTATRELAAWRLLKMWAHDESIEQAVTVKLIGVHEGESIVVTAPQDGALGELREGAQYCFRGFSGECIYEFTAPLLRECSEPFAYLHIGWPHERQVEKRERRAAARVKTELPCMIYPGANPTGRFSKGVITDLSTGGAAILLTEDLAIFYDQITVVFRLNVADEEVLVEARARPVRKPEESGEKLLGVSFAKLAPTDRLALHAFVAAAQVRELEVPLYAS
jgi:c-di-GMP-binding flagellar brake protein YcgR